MLRPELLRLPKNESGRDFVVGDIHGYVSRLMQQLDVVGFNPLTDRVICTGDLIDRGPESADALNLLDEDWFYSVMGNHEYYDGNYYTAQRVARGTSTRPGES